MTAMEEPNNPNEASPGSEGSASELIPGAKQTNLADIGKDIPEKFHNDSAKPGISGQFIAIVIVVLILISAISGIFFFSQDDDDDDDELNHAPLAVIETDKTTVQANHTITFDGSDSTDPDNDTLSFTWDFGDGSPEETGSPVDHVYSIPGNFTVTLVVSDGEESNTTSLAITVIGPEPVDNTAPVALGWISQLAAYVDEILVFNGSRSYDPNDDLLFFDWDFGDGSEHGSDELENHSYSNPGIYIVSLLVSDLYKTGTQTFRVIITHPPPVFFPPELLSSHPRITMNRTEEGTLSRVVITVENNVNDAIEDFSLTFNVTADNGTLAFQSIAVSDDSLFDTSHTATPESISYSFNLQSGKVLAYGESGALTCEYIRSVEARDSFIVEVDPELRPYLDDNYNKISDFLEEEIANSPPDQYVEVIMQFNSQVTGDVIDSFENHLGVVFENYSLIRGFYGVIPAGHFYDFVDDVGSLADFEFADANTRVNATLMYGVPQIRARPYVWDDFGLKGEPKTTVAVLDTGVDNAHTDLASNYKSDGAKPAWMDFAGKDDKSGQTRSVDDDRDGRVDEETDTTTNVDGDFYVNIPGGTNGLGWDPGHDETFYDTGTFPGLLDIFDIPIWNGTDGDVDALFGSPMVSLVGEDIKYTGYDEPNDPKGHGTHCAGIVAGDGSGSNANTVTLSTHNTFYSNAKIGGPNGRTKGKSIYVYMPFNGYLNGTLRWSHPSGYTDSSASVWLYKVVGKTHTFMGIISEREPPNNDTWLARSPCNFSSKTMDKNKDGDYADAGETNQVLAAGVYRLKFSTFKTTDGSYWGAAGQEYEVNLQAIRQKGPGDGKNLVIGVAPDTSIMGVKVLDDGGGGYSATILSGMQYVGANAKRLGITVASMSLGSHQLNNVLSTGVDALVKSGVVVVAAAGNDFDDRTDAGAKKSTLRVQFEPSGSLT